MTTLRVLVVDDQRLVREGLTAILSHLPGIELAGVARDGVEAVELVRRERPDVVLMDLVMPGLDGVQATRLIRERYPATQVVALTTYVDDVHLFGALQAGAHGYLTKNSSAQDVLRALRAAAAGLAPLDPAVQGRVVEAFGKRAGVVGGISDPYPDGLTRREAEVLLLVAAGLSNAEISARLYVSAATVKRHLHNVFGKIGVRDRAQAVVYAFKRGLAS